MQDTTQEFKSDKVRLTVFHKPACRVELQVEASTDLVKAARSQAIKSVAKEVMLPGFRKGKAPDELVLKKYPQDVDKRWQETIASLSYRESEKLCKIPLLEKDTKISFDMKAHSLEGGARLILSYETEPVPPKIDPSEIKLKSEKRPEVSDEKVDETIRQAQLFFATWKEITDRSVQEGDFVLLDVDVIEPPSNLFSKTRFEVTDKSMSQWMKNLVLGMNIGEEKEGISTPDENLTDEEKAAYSPKQVRLRLLAIEEASTPDLDDAFAQKLGVKSVEELRKSVHNLLNKQADEHVREKMHDQVSTYLLEHYPFDLPKTLIEKETRFRMTQLFRDNEFQQYWTNMGEEERKKTVQTIMEQSDKAVRMFYICRQILAHAHLKIAPTDLKAPARTPIEVLVNPQSGLHTHNQPELQEAEAYSRLILEKAEDYIIDEVTKSGNLV